MREKDIETLKERAKEMLDNNYSRKIGDEELYTIICKWENAAKELETYKKIAEKLAEYIEKDYTNCSYCKNYERIGFRYAVCNKYANEIECIIDCARNEVEK